MKNTTSLFKEFEPISKADWLAKLEKDLKGKSLESLTWSIGKGVEVAPFYTKEDRTKIDLPNDKPRNDWEIGEDLYLDDIYTGNTVVMKALMAGVEAPRLVMDFVPSVDALTIMTAGVEFDYISTHYKLSKGHVEFLEELIKLLDGQETSFGSVEYDPFEATHNLDTASSLLYIAKETLPNYKVITLKCDYQSTENIVDELSTLLTQATTLFTYLQGRGHTVKEINKYLQLEVPIGTSYFVNIAKIRAIKLLWLNLLNAYDLTNEEAPIIHAVTAIEPQMTDQHTNMIRTTTQAMAAVISGADRITVTPANAFDHQPTSFTQRIARNVQYLLRYESHLDQVVDVAKGSYYIENLTMKLAQAAWEKFQTNE